MANAKGRRRRFGALRQLASGQWQARYRGPDGLMRPADTTFETKTSAELWLTLNEAEILKGDWINPDAGKVLSRSTRTTGSRNGRICVRRRSSSTATCCAPTSTRISDRSLADIKEAHVRQLAEEPARLRSQRRDHR